MDGPAYCQPSKVPTPSSDVRLLPACRERPSRARAFREHSPPKQLDAREEPVVRHASEVHLQMPSGCAQDDASTVAMTSRSCPGRTSRDRLSRAQHKQTEAQSTP